MLDELHRIPSTDVVVPVTDRSNRGLRIRFVTRLGWARASLLHRMGLTLPEPHRIPASLAAV